MGGGRHMHAMVMVGLQCTYAGISLLSKAAFLQGMKPPVFIVYRQAIATCIIAPLALYNRRRNSLTLCLGLKSFGLIFAAAFFGITAYQNAYFEGLYLSSASVASAMVNLTPAVAFVMATATRLEKVDFRSIRSIGKILGTAICVGGAVSMALLKGPKLLNMNSEELVQAKVSLLGFRIENWLLGCSFLFGSCWCWSSWLILQVPVSRHCPDHFYSTTLTCFFGMLQSAIVTLFLEKEWEAWRINTALELGTCLFSGVGAAVSFFGQAWCVSGRGPVFPVMFNPLSTIFTTFFSCIFFHEEMYIGSLLGAAAVISGLYMVLWGKAKELKDNRREQEEALTAISPGDDVPAGCNNLLHHAPAGESKNKMKMTPTLNLQEPLLPHKTLDLGEP